MSMSQAAVRELMHKIFAELDEAREAGQKEYAHSDGNALRNFEALSEDLNITREQVLWIYLKKHLDGILAYINGHKSQREDVRGRIKDAIVYEILLWAMVEDSEHDYARTDTILKALDDIPDIPAPTPDWLTASNGERPTCGAEFTFSDGRKIRCTLPPGHKCAYHIDEAERVKFTGHFSQLDDSEDYTYDGQPQ